MARLLCASCGGEYVDTLPDGLRYFHACPPLPRVRVQLADGTIAIEDHAVRLVDVDDGKGGVRVEREFDPPLPLGATYLGDVFVDRPNKRDENVAARAGEDAGIPKAEGDGAVVLEP